MAASETTAPVAKKPKTVGFVDSFWSADYAGGLGILFQKLQQGVIENTQVLTIATMRADAEELYSERLEDIAPTIDRMTNGFARDDGASVKKAYEGVRGEMVEAAKNHHKISNNIRELVVYPFGRWCDAHALRVQNSQDDLQSKIKAHDSQADLVKKLRSQYFNKCRLVEDQEEENKLAFKEPEKTELGSPKQSPPPKIILPDEDEELPVELGDETFTPERMKEALTAMLNTIPISEFKVPVLGTYQNVSAGTDIVDFLQKHLGASSVGYAEKMGQDLVDRGFLRLIGSVGSTFANSSRMRYQWKTKVFKITGIPEKKKPLGRVSSGGSDTGSIDSPVANITETLQAWNPLNNPYPNMTPSERLRREAKDADEKYKAAIRRLDLLRCNLEESMMDHLKFLERCETDRLKAIKSVILDFSGAISNSIPSFQSQVDNMVLYQETINPLSDLRYFLENYRVGAFVPRPTPYENYYGSVDDQIFGVDLEARARADRKRVPVLVTSILTFLDNHYPDLEGDEARRSIWLVDVPLAATHHLRNQLNHHNQTPENGSSSSSANKIPREVLERYEIPIVASVLKLYLLELPDSLVSSQVYEIIKTIYATTSDATPNPISSDSVDSAPRIKVLQSTLGQLRLNNIATLDAITTHFTRLIDLTSADDAYVGELAHVLAPCILRPRTENTLTLEDRHAYRLVRDLFEHKEAIFGELKRQSSTLSASNSIGGRTRAASKYGARAKAISEARRDRSPAPTNRHRRDKSTDGSISAGRFPVVASPRPDQSTFAHRDAGARVSLPNKRTSLEVPGSLDSSPVQNRNADAHNKLAAITQGQPSVAAGNAGGPASAAPKVDTANGTPTATTASGLTDSPSALNTPTSLKMNMSAFGGPGPHIPPPVSDDELSDHASSPQQRKAALANNQAAFGQNAQVGGGSLKRSAAGSGKSAPLARGRQGTRQGTADSIGGQSAQQQGVSLSDKPFDDDFS
ncbi:Rho-GTPase-activating protein 8 [Cyphellophora attinorum]|uniref:Rho-GTPase-activating protein 8 n=1 Tax=Cyphellophora attinorum TaxID=1664694 RepID=A0A0N1P250_9EURO|nr:Rho-GTPase-activating protein 8 [Phialophora attinorum]KPI45944.1 Rho-GTPase-activating protein 8 [Phialophora attinorum]